MTSLLTTVFISLKISTSSQRNLVTLNLRSKLPLKMTMLSLKLLLRPQHKRAKKKSLKNLLKRLQSLLLSPREQLTSSSNLSAVWETSTSMMPLKLLFRLQTLSMRSSVPRKSWVWKWVRNSGVLPSSSWKTFLSTSTASTTRCLIRTLSITPSSKLPLLEVFASHPLTFLRKLYWPTHSWTLSLRSFLLEKWGLSCFILSDFMQVKLSDLTITVMSTIKSRSLSWHFSTTRLLKDVNLFCLRTLYLARETLLEISRPRMLTIWTPASCQLHNRSLRGKKARWVLHRTISRRLRLSLASNLRTGQMHKFTTTKLRRPICLQE